MISKKIKDSESESYIPDRKVINMNEYYDVEYWSAKFGISPEQLKLAVKHTGSTLPAEIEAFLHKT